MTLRSMRPPLMEEPTSASASRAIWASSAVLFPRGSDHEALPSSTSHPASSNRL